MTLSFRVFPTGKEVPGYSPPQTYTVTAGSPLTLFAPQTINEPSGSQPPDYVFSFWVVNSAPYEQRIPNPSPIAPDDGTVFQVTAWYLEGGGSGPPTNAVTTWAFSLNTDQVLGAPIVSRSPETVTAAAAISPYGVFDSWLTILGASTSAGRDLTVPAGECDAIALYLIPNPDPCLSIVEEIREYVRKLLLEGKPSPLPHRDPVTGEIVEGAPDPVLKGLENSLLRCAEEHGEA
jgi:hypothetical protein